MRLLDMLLCAVQLLLLVLCLDLWFCFSLCERIFNCCLRSFALARATSPCQSPRAGPQRFLVLVRVCWCCSPEYKKQKENRKSSSPIKKTQSSICTPRCAIIASVLLLLPSMPGKTRTSMPHSAMLCSPSMSRNTVSLSSEISPMSAPILPPALRPFRETAV